MGLSSHRNKRYGTFLLEQKSIKNIWKDELAHIKP